MAFKRAATCVATVSAAAGMSPAFAQERDATAGSASNVVSMNTVTGRESDAELDHGFLLGSFTIRPLINVDSAVTDNLYATQSDRRSDVFTTFAPEVTAQADHAHSAIAARLHFSRDFHAKYSTEDASQYGGSTDLRFDLTAHTTLSIDASADREVESRGNLGTLQLVQPARYSQFGGQATLRQEFGQLAVSLIGRGYRLSYSNATQDGVVISQKYRNFDILSGTGQAEYSVNGITSLVLRGSAEFRRYDLRPGDAGFDPITLTDRNAKGLRLEAGAIREITSLVYFVARAGYIHYNYVDPRLRDVSSFAYFGNLRWNITPLTTLNASAERRLDETTSPLTAGNLRDEFKLSADHELLRNLILRASVRYAFINPAGIADKSQELQGGAVVRYHVGRSLQLTLTYDHSQRTSTAESISYKANQLTLGIRYAR